jgi:hypothetical protein
MEADVSEDAKCICGCPRSRHAYRGIDRGHCIDCGSIQCPEFRPVKKEQPEPATKSVYERARTAVRHIMTQVAGHISLGDEVWFPIFIALDAGEAAKKRAEEAEKELRDWKTASENQIRVDPGQPGPNPEAAVIRACMAEGLSAARRGHFALISRIDELEPAYLLEKERRIAAEDRCMRLEGEIAVLTQGGNTMQEQTQIENAAAQPGRQCRVTEKLKGLTELMRANGVHRLELESAPDGQMSIRAIELEPTR